MKKCIWFWFLCPLLMIIEFPIVFLCTMFWIISQLLCKIQKYINALNNKLHKHFDPPRNYIVQIIGKDKQIWTRINDKLLTKKEAEKLGEEYKNQGYEIYIT